MLFSETHAAMHTPQPVQAFKSIAMPHLLPLYSAGGNSVNVAGGLSGPSSATAFGFARYSSASTTRTGLRPSIAKWFCVEVTRYTSPDRLTCAPEPNHGASDERRLNTSWPISVPTRPALFRP